MHYNSQSAVSGADDVCMVRSSSVQSLAGHPKSREIVAALERLPFLGEAELSALADSWRNTPTVATARRRALDPDQPLVLDILSAFDLIGTLFTDDVTGEGPHLKLPADVTRTALKATRDGIAALYARPSLSRWEAAALSAPWRRVMNRTPARGHWPSHLAPPVDRVIGTANALATRCHTPALVRPFDVVAGGHNLIDGEPSERETAAALTVAWDAAVFSGRQRLWFVLRRAAADGLARGCAPCRRSADEDDRRVGLLAADAACGLLVRDLIDDASYATLTAPVRLLREGVTASDGVSEL
jgi:hypothetical protein